MCQAPLQVLGRAVNKRDKNRRLESRWKNRLSVSNLKQNITFLGKKGSRLRRLTLALSIFFPCQIIF